MHNSSELSNALNPNISQDHRIAYAQNYSPNYAQSYSVAQNLQYQHQQQPQQQLQQVFFSGADVSAQVQYAEPQYLEHQQQESQPQLQQTPASIPQENAYTQPAQQQEFDSQKTQQAYPPSQEQQTPLSHLQQQPQPQDQHQELHSQQQYYDASQTQSQPSANLQDPYSTSTTQIPNQYMAAFGDAQSSSHIATANFATLTNFATPTGNYVAPTTAPMTQNVQATSQYPQYPSPRSAHTTPHVQHHQVSMREAVSTQPVASTSSFSADLSHNEVFQDPYAPPTAVETATVTAPYLPTTHNDQSREQTVCNYTSVLPTPALEPRLATPVVQPHAQQQSHTQSNQQPQPPQAGAPASESAASASHPKQTMHLSSQQQQQRQQQQQPKPLSRATDRSVKTWHAIFEL
jgi:hypothetical protein